MTTSRRAVILPVVLMILLLLGLLVAMFSFRVNADLASTQAVAYRLQTRLAAEAGIERVKLLLGEARYDMDRWYHNSDELHRIIVWTEGGDESVWGTNEEFEDEGMAYRFSIVADDPTDDEDYIRLGITDESSKINLNTATESQLLRLVRVAVAENEEVIPQDIVNAILDWRDVDQIPRGEVGDTEGEYYRRLPKPYRVKNGPFETVEELLLVKGVTDEILYGEDFDRNGLLTPNEDDDDVSFPLDNQDGKLNRGLYPYLTVHSVENNVSNDNRPRVYLFGQQEVLRQELNEAFPDDPKVVEFIVAAARSQGGGGGNSAENAGPGSGRFGSGPRGNTGNPRPGEGGEGSGPDELNEGNESAGTNTVGDAETGGGGSGPGTMRSPASLLTVQDVGGKLPPKTPVTLEDLPVLMDRTTTLPPEQRTIPGLININTAPRLVLQCIEGLTNEHIEAILERRERVPPETKATTAWLLTEEVVDLKTFEQIAPVITARGQQFRIEALGYGDHIGMVTRLEVVIDMVGPIGQTIYYRDLTYLGGHYPIREEDLEKIRVR
ncbi:MAG: general secretion pathway protein GspK [Phycisphaerales bacterium]|nr:MAG: general secretion pathway protein GspK [Phycisphaerales bacterium]